MNRTGHRSFRLQRLARSRFARLLAHAMAVLLVLANVLAVAAPVAAAGQPGAHAAAAASSHHHCDDASMKAHASAKSMQHGKGCPCCMGGACACLSSCPGVLAAMLPELALPPALQPSASADEFFVDAAGTRRLRPPIA